MLMSDCLTAREDKVGVFQIAILILSVVVLCAMVADTVFVLPQEASNIIGAIDTIVCAVFMVDFFLRFYRADNKWAFLKWGWIDLVASIPNVDVLRWGRLVRVLRIIRLLRAVRSVHKVLTMTFQNKVQGGAVSLALTGFLLIAFSSISILICERQDDANIKTAEDAVWWSITTMTTVGYGDKYPVTTEGRIIGMILMVAGIGIFAGLSGLAASLLLGANESKSVEMEEILIRLDSIETKLDDLNPQRSRSKVRDESR